MPLWRRLFSVTKKLLSWVAFFLWQKLFSPDQILFCEKNVFQWFKIEQKLVSVMETFFSKRNVLSDQKLCLTETHFCEMNFFCVSEICFCHKKNFCQRKLFYYQYLFLWQKLSFPDRTKATTFFFFMETCFWEAFFGWQILCPSKTCFRWHNFVSVMDLFFCYTNLFFDRHLLTQNYLIFCISYMISKD